MQSAGLSTRSLAAAGARIPSAAVPALRRMREIERFQERLAKVVNAETIPTWLGLQIRRSTA